MIAILAAATVGYLIADKARDFLAAYDETAAHLDERRDDAQADLLAGGRS